MNEYRAPRWLAGDGPWGGNLQTIWPALFARSHQGPRPVYRRERWTTPDQDFIDVDFQVMPDDDGRVRPMLVLFHGLEGSSDSHYARAFAHWARQKGWRYVVP